MKVSIEKLGDGMSFLNILLKQKKQIDRLKLSVGRFLAKIIGAYVSE